MTTVIWLLSWFKTLLSEVAAIIVRPSWSTHSDLVAMEENEGDFARLVDLEKPLRT